MKQFHHKFTSIDFQYEENFKSFIKKILPNFLINAILKVSSPSIDPNVLAFRVFLISKMNKILNDDCN